MNNISFKVSARAAILIGRENIANSEGAITELIKNCYDADSEIAYLLFDKNSIIIIDNGDGMNEEIIRNRWMVIGTNDKVVNFCSKKGRIKSGAKGIGRFALDKLGGESLIITCQEKKTLSWQISWEDFEKSQNTIDKIEYSLLENEGGFTEEIIKVIDDEYLKKYVEKLNLKKGTFIKITKLRELWQEKEIKKTYENLEMLFPLNGKDDFNLYYYDKKKIEKIEFKETFDYDYKVKAVLKNGEINIDLHRREFDIELVNDDFFENDKIKEKGITRKTFEYVNEKMKLEELLKVDLNSETIKKIGDFEVEFYYLKKTIDKKIKGMPFKSINTNERKDFLKNYSGIKIFRDNFRVRPYGEQGVSHDWLGLGGRYAKNPAGASRSSWKVGPDLVGSIKLSRIKNEVFEDKSSREGISETKYFEILKNILLEIIKCLEKDRSLIYGTLTGILDKKNENYVAIKTGEILLKKIENEKNEKRINLEKSNLDIDTKEKIEEIEDERIKLIEFSKAMQEENEELMNENALLRVYASSGLMFSCLSHEVKNILYKVATYDITFITKIFEEYIGKGVFEADDVPLINERTNSLQKSYATLDSWVNFSLNLIKKDKRSRKNISLNDFIYETKESWSKILEKYSVEMEVNIEKNMKLKCFKSDLESIFVNLIINSIEAFQKEGNRKKRKIIISISNIEINKILIQYSDTGPGLSNKIRDSYDILQPNFTTKIGNNGEAIGTGMGMSIVKTILDSYDAKLKIIESDGFKIEMKFIKKDKRN